MRKIIDVDHTLITKLKFLSAFEDTSVKALMEKAVSFYVAYKEKERFVNMSDEEKEDLRLLMLMQQSDQFQTVSEEEVLSTLNNTNYIENVTANGLENNKSTPVEVSNLTTRILFQIISDLNKNNFYINNNSYQNEHKIVYKTSQFINNYNKEAITKSLAFLKQYKHSIYSFINKNGKKIPTSGGLIKDWYFYDSTGNFEITICLYWVNKMLSLTHTDKNNLHDDILLSNKDNKGI